MNMKAMMKALLMIEEELNCLGEVESLSLVCMIIDYIAGRHGMKGSELIQELLPIMQDVNDHLGILRVQEESWL